MPSPLGHTLASALLYKIGISGKWFLDWKRLLFFLFCGIVPDLDFIPGVLAGNRDLFHHGLSHSFMGALGIAVVLWFVYGIWRKVWKISDFIFITGILFVHVVMDVLGLDTGAPYGCPVAYPFSRRYWMSPVVFFQDIHRASPADFFIGANNLLAFWIEFCFFLPLIIAASLPQRHSFWRWALACLFSAGVAGYYLRIFVISAEGIQFIRVLGG